MSSGLRSRAETSRTRIAELRAELVAADGATAVATDAVAGASGAVAGAVSAGEVTDMLERAGQATGALRLLSELRRRDAVEALASLRMQRFHAMRPVLLCRHRPRLRTLTAREDFLKRCVAYAEALPARTLVTRVEAEATLLLTASRYSRAAVGAAAAFDDAVAHVCVNDLLNWWHADPRHVTLRVSDVSEPAKDKFVLTVQVCSPLISPDLPLISPDLALPRTSVCSPCRREMPAECFGVLRSPSRALLDSFLIPS